MEKTEERKIVIFSLFKENMGIDISYVREVIAPVEIHPLPNTPDFIEGVVMLRNHIIAVIDLRKKFKINSLNIVEGGFKIVICRLKEFIIGLIVDSVEGVVTVDKSSFEEIPDIISSTDKRKHIEGVVNVDNKIITILNIEHILSHDEKAELSSLKDGK